MNIAIKGKDYKLKYTIRALFLFEQITNKPFEIKTLLDNYIFLYCIILANNEDPISWDEFIDEIDSNKSLLNSLNEVIARHDETENFLHHDEEEPNGEKKN